MNTYNASFELIDFDDNKIILGLTTNIYFKVLNSYVMYVRNISENYGELIIKTHADNLQGARLNIKTSLSILSFLFGFDLQASNEININEQANVEILTESNTKNKNIGNIRIFEDFLKKMSSEENNKAIVSINYFARSLRLVDLALYEEAFLTYYKCCEIIYEHEYKKNYGNSIETSIDNLLDNFLINNFNEEYKGVGNDLEAHTKITEILKKLVTARRKLIKVMELYSLDNSDNRAGNIVSKRNKVGAHATSKIETINFNLVNDVGHLAHQLITKFITNNQHFLIEVNGRKDW